MKKVEYKFTATINANGSGILGLYCDDDKIYTEQFPSVLHLSHFYETLLYKSTCTDYTLYKVYTYKWIGQTIV